MYNLLVILFSLYPTVFLFNSVPAAYIKKLDNLAPAGIVYFVSHLIVFGIIFFLVYSVLKRYVSIGYISPGKSGFVGKGIISVMLAAIITIIFYKVLPGQSIYPSPDLVDAYILSQPYTLILLLLPFGYLFFD